jgi:hypothetical protein
LTKLLSFAVLLLAMPRLSWADLLGVGIALAWLNMGQELVVEAFYKLGITAAAFIQLDAQYVRDPGGVRQDAWVGLCRFSVRI